MAFNFSSPNLDLVDLDRRVSSIQESQAASNANTTLLGTIGLDGNFVTVTAAGTKLGLSVGGATGNAAQRLPGEYVIVNVGPTGEQQGLGGIVANKKVCKGDIFAVVNLLNTGATSDNAWIQMKSGDTRFDEYARLDGADFTGAVTMAQTLEVTGALTGSSAEFTGDINADNATLSGSVTANSGEITTTLEVNGTATLNQLEVTTSASVTSDLTVGGDANVTGDVTAANATISEKVSTKELEVKDPTAGTGIILSESSTTPGEFTLDASDAGTVTNEKVIIKASEVSLDLGDGQQASPLITKKELEEGLSTVFGYRAGATATVAGATTFDLYADYCFCPKTKSCSMFLLTLDISLNAQWTPTTGDLTLTWKNPATVTNEVLNVKGDTDIPGDIFDGLFMPETSTGSNTKSFGVINLWTIASTSSFTGPVELGRFELVKQGTASVIKINVTSTTPLPQGTYRCRYQVQAIAPVGKKMI